MKLGISAFVLVIAFWCVDRMICVEWVGAEGGTKYLIVLLIWILVATPLDFYFDESQSKFILVCSVLGWLGLITLFFLPEVILPCTTGK